MARQTTDMQLAISGMVLIPTICKITSIGASVATQKNATLNFYGLSVATANQADIIFVQII